MAKLPEPPGVAHLQSIPPEYVTLKKGTTVWRLFCQGGTYPTDWNRLRYYGPTSSRFDHHVCCPNGKPGMGNRGIMYLAVGPDAIATCLAEFFQFSRTINRYLNKVSLTAFSLKDDLLLLNFDSHFPTRIGASMAINTGPRPKARRWAQQLYEAYPNAQGIYYPSSMYANKPSLALFERGKDVIPDQYEFNRRLSAKGLANTIAITASKIGYRCI